MQTVGNYLKSGREAKNISLSEVARTTKISKWYLDCLEQDDFDKMPGGPYIKGYISSYAAYIGIEEDEVLKCYDSLYSSGTDDEQIQPDQANVNKKGAFAEIFPNRKKTFFLSLAILLLVALGIYYFWPQNQQHTGSGADIQESKGAPVPADIDAPQIEDKTSSLTANQKYMPTTEQRDFPKNDEPLKETNDLIQGASKSQKPILETLPSPEKHGVQQVLERDSEIAASGLDSTVTADRDSVSSAGLDSTVTADRDSVSSAGLDSTVAADQDSESIGYPTEPARPQPAGHIKVLEATACTGVANRTPQGTAESFKWTTDRVYIWSLVESANHPTSVHHIYFFKGQKVSDIELKIRSSRWRTWSYKTLLDKRFIGPWRVDITSAEGKLLQRVNFDVN
jgi:cytoskeletal protein RodZ